MPEPGEQQQEDVKQRPSHGWNMEEKWRNSRKNDGRASWKVKEPRISTNEHEYRPTALARFHRRASRGPTARSIRRKPFFRSPTALPRSTVTRKDPEKCQIT